MKYKLSQWLLAGAFGAALALAPPAFAFRGGGGGGGGHMGGGFGGMGGGMHAMGGGMGGGMHSFGGGGMHFSGMGGGSHVGGLGGAPHFAGSRFGSAPFAHAAFTPGFSRFGSHERFGFHDRFAFHHRFFHHRFHRFAFFGAFAAAYPYYDDCWRRVWTRFGPRLVNVCYDYGDYGYY
jgi:hypothetical protein